MRVFHLVALTGTLLVCVYLTGCNDKVDAPTAARSGPTSPDNLDLLRKENAQLKEELASLKKHVAELEQTPQMLLDKVGAAAQAQDLGLAKSALTALQDRFGDTPQTSEARKVVAQLEKSLKEREAEAKRVAALGFFALTPAKSTGDGGVTLKVESVKFGKWTFDSHDDTFYYKNAERGQVHLLLNASVTSTAKDPALPDVAVFRIDGKEMRRVAGFTYRFRRWQSHATYIGLYHDPNNDFAYSPTVTFNAGTELSEEDAKQPLAVVATSDYCHQRRQERVSRPEVSYEPVRCGEKDKLIVDDFAGRNFTVLSFINRPKAP